MSKFDPNKPLFVGPTAARGDTVFDALRQVVRDLQHEGEGAQYSHVEANMLANFKPKNAKKYDASYIKAYTRDAVTKFGYLSQSAASEYSVQESKSRSSADKPSDEGLKMEILQFIREKGEVSNVEEIDASQITIETLSSELGKKSKTITKAVSELESEGLVRTEQREASVYVYLTEEGWNKIWTDAPNIAAQEAADAEQAALRESSGVAAETGEVVSPEAEGEYHTEA
jgi:DNA-binding MarR family transcriptional regulator